MDDALTQLLEVQDLDFRLVSLQRQIDSVPAEQEQVQTQLSGATAKLQTAKQKVMDLEAAIKKVEMDISDVKGKKANAMAKSNAIKKNDEYKLFLHEIAQFDAQISRHEDRELELMEELEEARAERVRADKDHKATEARVKEAQADLGTREKACQEQLEKIRARRQEAAAKVPAALLARYDRQQQRAAKSGQMRKIVAPIEGDACGSCYLTVTAAFKQLAQRGQMVSCEQCGAILYVER